MKSEVVPWNQVDLAEVAGLSLTVRGKRLGLNSVATTGDVAKWLDEKFSDGARAAVIAHDGGQLAGWLLLSGDDDRLLEINPWLLGGHPIIDPDRDWPSTAGLLLAETRRWAAEEGIARINLISGMADEKVDADYATFYQQHNFNLQLKYVEMICHLSRQSMTTASFPPGYEVASLETAALDELYDCYYQAFAAGDAAFFFDQAEDERRDYFGTLGYEAAVGEEASIIIRQAGRLVAFVYVMPFGDDNRHISCMCVQPELHGQGLGRLLLDLAMSRVAQQGHKTITLGTETGMRAYDLYLKNGFRVNNGAIIYAWEKPAI